jgi:hypothetical protein
VTTLFRRNGFFALFAAFQGSRPGSLIGFLAGSFAPRQVFLTIREGSKHAEYNRG